MRYFNEGIGPIKFINNKINKYGLDTNLKELSSHIDSSGSLVNETEITVSAEAKANLKEKLNEVMNNILQDLGIASDVIEYQFSRKRGPDFIKLCNNTRMTIADEPTDNPKSKKMRI